MNCTNSLSTYICLYPVYSLVLSACLLHAFIPIMLLQMHAILKSCNSSQCYSKPDIECEAKRKICISWRCDNQSLRTSDLLSPRTGKLSMHKQWKERHSTVWHNSFTQMPSGSSSQNLNGMFTFCLHILLNLHCWPCFPLPEDIKRAVKILNNFTGKRSRRFRIHNQNLTLSIQILSTAATFDE